MLKGFLDAPSNYFYSMENIAFMWVSEVSRTVLDRHGDQDEIENLYELTKQIASEVFNVKSSVFPEDC